MDPLNLLRELYGEEPIRRILSSGFDSVSKIAAATPESLSFFSGIQESLARQIIQSAEGEEAGPASRSPSDAAAAGSALPTQPREMARSAPPRKSESARLETRKEPMDERPLLDAGGILKSLSKEPHPKELLNEDEFLENLGLSHAEAGFLQGISSPWSAASRERSSPVSFEPLPASEATIPGTEMLEFAPISDWSPDREPDPVPRLIRAVELGPEPAPPHLPALSSQAPVATEILPLPESFERADPVAENPRRSFWRFGR